MEDQNFEVNELGEFIDLIQNEEGMPFHFYTAVHTAIRKGMARHWLQQIGEQELASFLRPFEDDPARTYGVALSLFEENRIRKKRDLSNVVGYESAKRKLLEMSLHPEQFKEISKKYKKNGGGAVLLYGPPGCGKTNLAISFAGESSKLFMKRGGSDFFKPSSMKWAIDALKKITNVILFIDEIEMLGIDRDMEGMHSRAMTNEILVNIDSSIKDFGILVVGATNTPWVMDTSVLRSGRFDEFLYIGFPSVDEREKLLEFYTKNLPLDGVDFSKIASKTEFYSCSDMEAVCSEAAAIPWREAILGKKERRIDQEDFDKALEMTEPTAIPWLDEACNVMFGQNMKSRFAPMVADIEKYKRTK